MIKRLSAVLISAVLLSACDGGGRPPTAPSVPTPTPTPAPAPQPTDTYTLKNVTLSGVISNLEGSNAYRGCLGLL